MEIIIICIGKLKERYWTEAIAEYSKRLSRFCSLRIEELKEEKLAENASAADEEFVKEAEGKRILEKIPAGAYVIPLDVRGKELSSEALASRMEDLALMGKSKVVFIIGGSLGLSSAVLQRGDFRLSFSPMTFPHQMMRVILLEQIYRSFKIRRNEAYHK